jgi:hypothetical protein
MNARGLMELTILNIGLRKVCSNRQPVIGPFQGEPADLASTKSFRRDDGHRPKTLTRLGSVTSWRKRTYRPEEDCHIRIRAQRAPTLARQTPSLFNVLAKRKASGLQVGPAYSPSLPTILRASRLGRTFGKSPAICRICNCSRLSADKLRRSISRMISKASSQFCLVRSKIPSHSFVADSRMFVSTASIL